MYLEIRGNIEDIELIAIGSGIRELARLQKRFGPGRWRTLKETANVQPAHGIGKWKMKLERFIQSVRAMKDSTETFALCIDPAGAEDLEKGKVYRVLRDTSAEEEGLLRVIDESAEDYLYPSACFVFIDLPQKAREALAIDA